MCTSWQMSSPTCENIVQMCIKIQNIIAHLAIIYLLPPPVPPLKTDLNKTVN